MDVRASLQKFEASLSSYTGDDPLDLWDRYVNFLEQKLPPEESGSLSVVLDRLVQTFLTQKRYCNDIRYINLCLKCASFYSEPINLYSFIYGEGVGTQAAVLYLAWAQQFEKQGMFAQANMVYQRAIENQAEPAELVLEQYQSFHTRAPPSVAGPAGAVRNPLQDSQLTNQMVRQREAFPTQCKDSGSLIRCPADQRIRIISRSESVSTSRACKGSETPQTVSMYCKSELECEGSELCFEELRANRYFEMCRQQKELQEMQLKQRHIEEEEEQVRQLRQRLAELESRLEPQMEHSARSDRSLVWTAVCSQQPQASCLQEPLHTTSSSLALCGPAPTSSLCPLMSEMLEAPQSQQAVPPYVQGADINNKAHKPQSQNICSYDSTSGNKFVRAGQQTKPCEMDVPDQMFDAPDLSQGATGNLSHITPNTSLGIPHTPSRVQPSPTVNTREALGVIMDMFQAPTFFHNDPFSSSCHDAVGESFESACRHPANASSLKPAAPAPFTIFQDENDQENAGAAVRRDRSQASRILGEIPVGKPAKQNNTPGTVECMTDEITMWGERYNHTLPPCPNSTHDFSLSAHLVSTPFQSVVPHCWDTTHDQDNNTSSEETNYQRPGKKLSPILEQSPADDKDLLSETRDGAEQTTKAQGSIFTSERFLATSTIFEPPHAAALSFPERTLGPQEAASVNHVTKPEVDWDICMSPTYVPAKDWFVTSNTPCVKQPELSPKTEKPPLSDWVLPKSPEPTPMSNWVHHKSAEPAPLSDWVLPVSPEPPVKSDWLHPKSPEPAVKSDWLLPKSPEPAVKSDWLLPKSPEPAVKSDWLLPKSPEPAVKSDWLLPKSPEPAVKSDWLLPKSPEPAVKSDWLLPKSPEPAVKSDWLLPMSPETTPTPESDIPMSPDGQFVPMSPHTVPVPAPHLVPNPWDDVLISSLLSNLSIPLSSSPDYHTWNFRLPNFVPKLTIAVGKDSYHVDCILGQGAFATVYQARNLTTSKKLVLKVQKPANPWEFYINNQLNQRLEPRVRHLYNLLYSAHLFHNGSVLVGELHNYGTLLNAVNLYRSTSEKVMPQPLVMHFSVCVLQMVELLHSANIVHADIKPDNFLLGERFLENECFDVDHVDHGLTLIDLGQSIDMELFPPGTAFTAQCMTSGFQCTEMLSGRPWNYQTDYFGIAGTVYCLIFGTYMKVKCENGVWQTNAAFKRHPHSDLWTDFFHTLLNVPDCDSLPCLRSLRNRISAELQQSYGNKLRMLKKRLVGQLLESKRSRK